MQQEVRWSAESGLLRTWKVQPGSVVSEGDVLALVEPRSASLVAPVSGTVVHCLVRNNSKLVEGQALCTISTCNHQILTITDVCASCHVHLHDTSAYAFYITPSNHPIKRRVADVEAESESKKRALLASSRLVLVLDLDQTVLHAAQLLHFEEDLASKMHPEQSQTFAFELSGRSRMIVKFRPGLRQFLLEAHKLFEIHVYTMANAEYAAKIVDLINKEILTDLDPILRNQIIGSRIITRSHTEDAVELQLRRQGGFAYSLKLQEKRKDIKHIVGDSSIAVILDDSEGVWPDYLDHLIHVHPFVYWPGQDDLNKTFHNRSPATQSQTTLESSSSSKPEANPPNNSENGNAQTEQSAVQSNASRKRPAEGEATLETELGIDGNVKRRKETEENDSESTQEHKVAETENGTLAKSEKSAIDDPSSSSHERTVNGSNNSGNHEESDSETKTKQDEKHKSKHQTFAPVMLEPFGIRFLPSRNNDRVLDFMLIVLQRLHAQFFALPVDSKRRKVQLILPRLRKQVLKGRRICLSGVIPHQPKAITDESDASSSSPSGTSHAPVPDKDHDPRWQELSRVAQREMNRVLAFGAEYVEDLASKNPQKVTHMVSARGSTMKVRKAVHEKNIYCVTKKWLDHTTRYWQAQNEADYRIPEIPLFAGTAPTIEGGVYDVNQQGEIVQGSIWSEEDLELDRQETAEVPTSPALSDSFFDLEALLEHEDELSSIESYDSEMEFA